MFDLSVEKAKIKIYKKNNFDINEYILLQNQVKDLQDQLSVIESRA